MEIGPNLHLSDCNVIVSSGLVHSSQLMPTAHLQDRPTLQMTLKPLQGHIMHWCRDRPSKSPCLITNLPQSPNPEEVGERKLRFNETGPIPTPVHGMCNCALEKIRGGRVSIFVGEISNNSNNAVEKWLHELYYKMPMASKQLAKSLSA